MTDRSPRLEERAHLRDAPVYLAEAIATALLLAGGLSAVIVLISPAGPFVALGLPDAVRRFAAGGLFGLTGTAVSLSRWGRRSGAHLNPAVTLAFWLEGRISRSHTVGYLLAQCVGATAGAAAVLAWGPWGQPLDFGATVPRAGLAAWTAVLLEASITFVLVTLVLSMAARPTLRHLTPWTMGPLYAVLVAAEAPLTGTSTNPARSIGPALVTWTWTDQWVYLVGPLLGAAVAVGLIRLGLWGEHRVLEARLVYPRWLRVIEERTGAENAD